MFDELARACGDEIVLSILLSPAAASPTSRPCYLHLCVFDPEYTGVRAPDIGSGISSPSKPTCYFINICWVYVVASLPFRPLFGLFLKLHSVEFSEVLRAILVAASC